MIQLLPFDSNLFGYSVGSLLWEETSKESLLLEEAKDFKLVYIFSDQALFFTHPHILQVDIKITFEKQLLPGNPVNGIFPFEKEHLLTITPEEREMLRYLALESGKFSRFRLDPRLTHDEFERLYRFWIDQAMISGNLLQAEKNKGMVSFSQKKEKGKIELIAVLPENQQMGWGKKLVQAAEHLLFERGVKTLQISTQESNLLAMHLYRNLGYQITEKTFVYHYWRGSQFITS